MVQGLEVIVCKLGILQASSLRMKRVQMNAVHSSLNYLLFSLTYLGNVNCFVYLVIFFSVMKLLSGFAPGGWGESALPILCCSKSY